MELLRIKQRQNSYHNFTVDDREVGKLVLDVMNETNFFGVTVSCRSILFCWDDTYEHMTVADEFELNAFFLKEVKGKTVKCIMVTAGL